MKKQVRRKNLILITLLIVLSVALIATSVTLAINIFSHEEEKTFDFGIITLNTTLNTAFNSGNLDNVISGQKIADKIQITNSELSNTKFYLRVQFVYTTDNNDLLPRNQLQYLAILNNTFNPYRPDTETSKTEGYRWGEREGDYFYLYDGNGSNLLKVQNTILNEGTTEEQIIAPTFDFVNELIFAAGMESYPAEYSKPTGLKLVINIQVIQADYLNVGESKEVWEYFDDVFPDKYITDVTFDINFESNGGTGVAPYLASVPYGTEVTLPPVSEKYVNGVKVDAISVGFTKANYTLVGWHDGVETHKITGTDGPKYTVTGNVTFKAVWRITETPEEYFIFTKRDFTDENNNTYQGYTVRKNPDKTLPGFTVIPTKYNGLNVIGIDAAEPVITDGVVESFTAGKTGFANAKEIVTLYIPISETAESLKNGLTGENKQIFSIGKYAFYGCSAIAEIVFESDLETIGEYAFSNCTNLREINMPQSVTSLGKGAFSGCSTIRDADLSPALETISEECFLNCISLREVIFPRNLVKIDKKAFYGCVSIKEVEFPHKLKTIGDYAFAGSSNSPMQLTKIEYEYGLKFDTSQNNGIGKYAFSYCQKLEQVVIPDEITTLSEGVFEYCIALKDVQIGDNLKVIGKKCFSNCASLVVFNFPIKIPSGSFTIDEAAFEYCTAMPSIALPIEVKTINNKVFIGCSSLKRVTAEGVTEIKDQAFKDCTVLIGINSQRYFYLPKITTIGVEAFKNNISVTEIVLGKTLKTINNFAFEGCSSLVDLDSSTGQKANIINFVNHSNLTRLGTRAFKDCTSIVSVILPTALGKDDVYAGKDVGGTVSKYQFANNTYLANYNSTNYSSKNFVDRRDKYALGEGLFYNCSSLTYFNGYSNGDATKSYYARSLNWNMQSNFIREYMFYGCAFYAVDVSQKLSSGVTFGIACLQNCTKVSLLYLGNVTSSSLYVFDQRCFYGFGTSATYANKVLTHADNSRYFVSSAAQTNKYEKDFNVRFTAGQLVVGVGTCAYNEDLVTALGNVSEDVINIQAYFDWADSSAWNGTDVAESFAGGTGLADNPYKIATPAQFAYFKKVVNENIDDGAFKHYVITCSLNMNNKSFGGIGAYSGKYFGTADAGFRGTLTMGVVPGMNVKYSADGRKTFNPIAISGIYVVNKIADGSYSTSDAYAGLFNVIGKTGVVQGLVIKASSFYSAVENSDNNYNGVTSSVTKGGSYAGAIAGINCGLIQDCYVGMKTSLNTYEKVDTDTQKQEHKVYTDEVSYHEEYKRYVVKVTYENDGSQVTIGYHDWNTRTTDAHNGGIAGQQWFNTARIRNCFVGKNVHIRGTSRRWSSVGGIIGSNNNALVEGCVSAAIVAGYSYGIANGGQSSYIFAFVGGIAGVNAGILYACYVTSKISGDAWNGSYTTYCKSYIGGVCGYVHNQYGTGSATGSGTTTSFTMDGSAYYRVLSGRVGVINCSAYSMSWTTDYNEDTTNREYIGSFIGRLEASGSDYIRIYGYNSTSYTIKKSTFPQLYEGNKAEILDGYDDFRRSISTSSSGTGIVETSGSRKETRSSEATVDTKNYTVPTFIAFVREEAKAVNNAQVLIAIIGVTALAVDVVGFSVLIGNKKKKVIK